MDATVPSQECERESTHCASLRRIAANTLLRRPAILARPLMPRRLFKPLSRQRHRLRERWFMQPFRVLLEHPVYWSLNRRNVTLAFALGVFLAFVPLPGSFLLAAILALILRL